jgi:hypothetical protein
MTVLSANIPRTRMIIKDLPLDLLGFRRDIKYIRIGYDRLSKSYTGAK